MRKKQTKILATISDLMCDPEFIRALYENGMDAVRLNTAHQDIDQTRSVVENVRKVSNTIGILLDTKGPEVRTTKVSAPLQLTPGMVLSIRPGLEESTLEVLHVNYHDFVSEIPVGAPVLIDDGLIELKVIEKSSEELKCRVIRGGLLKSKKTVNTPTVSLNIQSLSKRDIDYIKFSVEYDLDFIAHSFVRNKEDVLAVQNLLDELKSPIKIIAKIESRSGVDNIDEILDHVYGIMIARGDLGVEIPAEEVPVIQKRLIQKCIERGKIVITATQMLHTMIENPIPTRAEVSDVANAILDGTDVLMLSGETSAGKYPVEAVHMMSKIAKNVERERGVSSGHSVTSVKNKISSYLAKAAVLASLEFNAKAILIGTHSGRTARIVSAYRGHVPIFAQCYSLRTVRWLSLSYGVYPGLLPVVYSTSDFVSVSLHTLLDANVLTNDDLIVIIGGAAKREDSGSTFIEVNTVKSALEDLE